MGGILEDQVVWKFLGAGCERSLYYRGVSQWNALTADLKNSININIFKRGLFKRIFNKDYIVIYRLLL